MLIRRCASLKISRRGFLQLAFGFTASSAFLALITLLPKPEIVRPPLAVDEDKFLSLCTRCGTCIDVCPTLGLRPATLADGIANIGTPKLTGNCYIHSEINCTKCAQTCPTGAIHTDKKVKIEFNESKCIACMICVKECPVEAVKVSKPALKVKIEFNESKCIACMICVEVCPVDAVKTHARALW